MMGNRGNSDGIEVDAFCDRARRALVWRRGELKNIKRAFSKRARRLGRRAMMADLDNPCTATKPGSLGGELRLTLTI